MSTRLGIPLDDYLARLPGRCRHGFDIATQHPQLCSCAGEQSRDATLAAVSEHANPDVKARLEAAIRRHAHTGQPFSMNNLRTEVPDATGPVVGSVFGALSNAKVIDHIGYEPSTKPNTKAHPIKVWKGVAA